MRCLSRCSPQPSDCDDFFAGYPDGVGVWRYARRFSAIDFTENLGRPLADGEHWMRWLPPDDPERFLATLATLEGGETYLIQVREGAEPLRIAVKGRPVLPRYDLLPKTMNFHGFWVHPTDPPTFAEYLADVPSEFLGSCAICWV